jgi:hypothetical protein
MRLWVAPIQGADVWERLLPWVTLRFTPGCDIASLQDAGELYQSPSVTLRLGVSFTIL